MIDFLVQHALDPIFLPFEPFDWHPGRIAVVAGVFLFGYLVLRSFSRFRAWPLLVAAIAWGLWVPLEQSVTNQWPIPSIRIDLILIEPLLLIVTLWALITSFWLKSPKESLTTKSPMP
jgi:hypothetical protein